MLINPLNHQMYFYTMKKPLKQKEGDLANFWEVSIKIVSIG